MKSELLSISSPSARSQNMSPRVHFELSSNLAYAQADRQLDRESYYADYHQRAKDLIRLIENFMAAEISTLKRDNLPGEYYVLRKNFDILYRLFKVILCILK
jgi:hypothetical protein